MVRYEAVKKHIRENFEENKIRYNFFRPFHDEHPLEERLKEMREKLEMRSRKARNGEKT